MPSTAHIPDLVGRENRSLASQCIKTKIQCTPIVKNQIITRNEKKKERLKQSKNRQHLQQPPGSTVGSAPVAVGGLLFARGGKELNSLDVCWKSHCLPFTSSAVGRLFDIGKDQ